MSEKGKEKPGATDPVQTFLDDEDRKRRYESALAEIKSGLEEIEDDFDDCQRLSEADFVVRINARDDRRISARSRCAELR